MAAEERKESSKTLLSPFMIVEWTTQKESNLCGSKVLAGCGSLTWL